MGKWVLAVIAVFLFKLSLNFDAAKLCKKRTSLLTGEELVCYNASVLFFVHFNVPLNRTHWLTCENCTLPTIDSDTFNITKNNIAYLYLISSKIDTLKELAFGKFKQLRVLNLRNNSIAELNSRSFANLNRLTQLDLSHNAIRVLTNNMFAELPNLNLLKLSFNTIYYLQPHAFRGLPNLKHLHLSNNQIQKLDRNIFQYASNLVLLHLENNHILEIDSLAFTNLGKLNSLYLNNNSISFLTQYNFKPLNNLVDLQLRGNNLSEIQTSSFNGLTNLKYLYLGNNRLRTVKRYGFIGLDNLQNLELINNDFRQFDLSLIQNMKNLYMVWLQHNHLANLTVDFKLDPLNSLNSLGISDNNLTTLNYKMLYNKLPNIRDIFIYNNTWKCEFLVNMFNFFQEKDINLCVSIDCDANKTRHYVEESCVAVKEETEDKEDLDADFVTEGGTFNRISIILVLVYIQVLIFV
ncbi:hypothetical protein MTP99_016886 [Tenebrio molitor]|jgi:Leucine-rich repeat (LRR) protein|nr:hypothetical protein MTP99_016886 [Tenebrio molitor]